MNSDEIEEFLWGIVKEGNSGTVVDIDGQVDRIVNKWLDDKNEATAEVYQRYRTDSSDEHNTTELGSTGRRDSPSDG